MMGLVLFSNYRKDGKCMALKIEAMLDLEFWKPWVLRKLQEC
jgi:hypothetical protein